MKYVVFSDESSLSLAERVNRVLNEEEGWELQGGVSCSLSESDDFRYTLFAQALIKKSAQQAHAAEADSGAPVGAGKINNQTNHTPG